jgi:cellulose synthase/poly-beta-1,6-N-acetylglucosamine synthase-like glycosyltransferase
MKFVTIENVSLALAFLFVICFFIQLYYYLLVFIRLSFYKYKEGEKKQPPVSVIICARNELKNLKINLPLILEQDYPSFQVIVVNDCSWDESEKFLEEMAGHHANLKIVTIKEQERYEHGKKFALTLGIKSAGHEILLMTDADCFPGSKNWISEMMNAYHENTQIVIGYGAYIKQKSLINTWVRFDTAFNAMQYFSYALGRNTYMGVGRNLSYTRSLFFGNKGFASHQHIMSGDDDLFINETANSSNANVCLQHEAFTYSHPKTNFKDWFRQKKRHISAGKLYKFKHKFSLGLFLASQILFYVLLIALLIIKFKIVWLAACYGLRLVIQLFIFGSCLKKLKEADLILLLPVYDVMIVLIYPALAFSNFFFKNKTWK